VFLELFCYNLYTPQRSAVVDWRQSVGHKDGGTVSCAPLKGVGCCDGCWNIKRVSQLYPFYSYHLFKVVYSYKIGWCL